MKRLALTGIAIFGLALGALAQGSVNIDNTASYNPGVAIATGGVESGTYYSGTFGMEVWEDNASAVPAGINYSSYGSGAGTTAYAAMTKSGSGFKLEQTFKGATMSSGAFSLGPLTMADVSPAGATVVIGLAVWDNSAATFTAGAGTVGAHSGVVAFVNPTVNPTGSPPPTPAALTGWTSGDLVMVTSVPEPGTFALAGLGVAALLILRRRK